MPTEDWVTFELVPNYRVSSFGRIENLRRNTELTLVPDAKGYYRTALYHNGKRFDVYIHRLVAKAFLPDYVEGMEVTHFDEDKSNNRADNLVMSGKASRIGENLW